MDISDLTPELLPYLGQAAYFELGMFENLAQALRISPDLDAKEGLSVVAGRALAKHQGLVAEIRRRGGEPAEVMAPFAPALDDFRAKTMGADWHELLLTCYLAGGLLDDFFIRLSDGLPGDVGPRIAHLLGQGAGTDVLVTHLKAAIDGNPGLGSHLALWGRRLVGDTMLVARSAQLEVGGTGCERGETEGHPPDPAAVPRPAEPGQRHPGDRRDGRANGRHQHGTVTVPPGQQISGREPEQ